MKKVTYLLEGKKITRYKYINLNKKKFNVRRLCKLLKVSRQGYYSYLKRRKSKTNLRNEVLLEKIKKVYEDTKGFYGSPRISEELNKQGIFTSKNRVARLMQKINLQAKTYKRKKGNYRKISENLISENLLKQNFKSNKRNEIWVGDITYIPVKNKYIYLASF